MLTFKPNKRNAKRFINTDKRIDDPRAQTMGYDRRAIAMDGDCFLSHLPTSNSI